MKRSLPFATAGMLLLAFSTLAAQTGPGGVGASDGSSALEIWLRGETGSFYTSASTIATATGDTVAQWRDRSGNDRHAIAASTPTDRRPLLRAGTDGLNGHSIVRFDGINDFFRTGSISPALSQPFTLFTLSRKIGSATTASTIADSRTSGANTLTQGYWTNTTQARINAGTNLTLGITQGDFTILRGIFDGASSSLAANGGTAATGNAGVRTVDGFTIGATRNSDGVLNGEIAEVIAYSAVLNAAERCVVENHLSARYAVAITGDHYASTTHIDDVIGIGRESGGAMHTLSEAAGLVLKNDGFLADAGDYLFAGHAGDTSMLVADDVPDDLAGRWNRIWYLEKTAAGSGSGDLLLGFDFGDGGFNYSPATIADYALLYRSGASGDFTLLTASSMIEGDRILFDIPEADLANGYYTLGTTNGGDAPLPVELAQFTLTLEAGHVNVAWATASEQQNAGFLLSRSEGSSEEYLPIASHQSDQRLVGAGTSSTRNDYSWIDPAELAPGLYHYRLVDVDLDGIIGSDPHYCSILVAPSGAVTTRLFLGEIEPNPISDKAGIHYEIRDPGAISFILRDQLGRTLSATRIDAPSGPGQHHIDVSKVPPGTYFLTMQHRSFVRTRRVVVAK